MLEDAERRVAALEQTLQEVKAKRAPLVSMPAVVERYLRDLRATLHTNVDDARRMLGLAVDTIVLRREGLRLVAQIRGNLAGVLSLDGCVNSVGAGRGIPYLATWPEVAFAA